MKAAIDASMLDKLESLIKTDVVKEKLKQRTQEALDQGVRVWSRWKVRVWSRWKVRVWSRREWKGEGVVSVEGEGVVGCGLGVKMWVWSMCEDEGVV